VVPVGALIEGMLDLVCASEAADVGLRGGKERLSAVECAFWETQR